MSHVARLVWLSYLVLHFTWRYETVLRKKCTYRLGGWVPEGTDGHTDEGGKHVEKDENVDDDQQRHGSDYVIVLSAQETAETRQKYTIGLLG